MATDTNPTATATTTVKAGLPTLHHLNNSQSQRILWLLEELQVPYNLSLYERQTSGPERQRAPHSLKEIHPLGKSPILVTSDGITISESTTITTYLLKTYDTSSTFTASDWIRDDSLCSFAASSVGTMTFLKLFLDIVTNSSPALARPLVRIVTGGVDKQFFGPEIRKALKYLQDCLGEEQFFGGKGPVKADFVLSFPMDMLAHRRWVDIEAEYPKLAAWRKRCQEREAWKRALEKGNGYDLSVF